MTTTSGGFQVVKNPQYIEEATYGTTPASPTLLWTGATEDIKPTVDMGVQDIRKVGSEDVYMHNIGTRSSRLELDLGIQSSTFLKYAINSQGAGTGSIDKSLSLLWSVLMNGTENYFIATGCRPDTLKLAIKKGQRHLATMTLFAQAIANPSASGPTGATYATDPASNPWNFSDMGSTPVTVGGSNVDVTEINFQFARNLEEVYTLQQTTPMYLPPKNREITGDLTVVWSSGTLMTDLQALTEVTLAATLKSATSVLTLSNVAFHKLDALEFKPTEVVYEKYTFNAKTAAVT